MDGHVTERPGRGGVDHISEGGDVDADGRDRRCSAMAINWLVKLCQALYAAMVVVTRNGVFSLVWVPCGWHRDCCKTRVPVSAGTTRTLN